jgi:outer membrane protein assembly factor BamB
MLLQIRLRFSSLVALVVFGVLFASTSPVVDAQSWPQYRGPNGDSTAPAESGAITWSGGQPKEVWKTETALGFSSFSVADGRAITLVAAEGDAGEIAQTCVALDAQTGEQLWSYALNKHDYGRHGGGAGARGNKGGDGPRSTPTIDGDRVYVYDAQLLLVCLKADSGELIWKVDVLNDFQGSNINWSNAISPVVDGERVYVAGGGAGQSMMALNKLTGEVIWKTGDEEMTHATPIVREIQGKQQVIFFMQSGLIALNPTDGVELWRAPFDYRTSSAASPVVDGNLVYCSAGYGVGAGLFEIGDSMSVKEVWKKPNRLMNHWSTPVLHEGHLYGLFSFKRYGTGPLQCVELATGEIKWEKKGFGPGNCILVGEKLVVLSDSGELVLVKAVPDAYEELARAKVLKGKCWSTPAYSDGKVYVRSTLEGACIDVGQ